jgi:hypothetical protein
MSGDTAKRRIRKLLHLAADARGNAAMARAARSLAKRLLRAQGWTEDDLRDGEGSLPTDATLRIVLPSDGTDEERFLAVSKLVMTKWKSITVEAKRSLISDNAFIYLTGAKAELKPAETLWHWLNETLGKYWSEEQEAGTVGDLVTRKLSSIFSFATVRIALPPDELSWLKGVLEGFWMAEQQDVKWRDALQAQEAKKQLPPPKPKRKRRCLPVKNPLALTVIPKPTERKSEPSQDWKDCAQMQITAHKLVARKVYADEVEGQPEPKEKHPLEHFSYRRGFAAGRKIYETVNAL